MYCCHVILLLALGTHFLRANRVYLSNSGDDALGCGEFLNNSCRTIGYVLHDLPSDVNTIILDGGDREPMTYHISNEISVSRSISFIGRNESMFRPVIANPSPGNISTIYAFNISITFSKVSLSFLYIDFKNINIIACRNALCLVSICQSKIETSIPDYTAVIYLHNHHSTALLSTVDIKNCSFVVRNSIIRSIAWISISVKNTFIDGGGIIHFATRKRNSPDRLTLDNVILRNIIGRVVHLTLEEKPSISITNTRFYGIKSFTIVHVSCERIHGCNENSNGITIQNTSFIGCTAHFLAYFLRQSLYITHSTFKNNSFLYESSNAIRAVQTNATLFGVSISKSNPKVFYRGTLIYSLKSRMNVSFVEINEVMDVNRIFYSSLSHISFFNTTIKNNDLAYIGEIIRSTVTMRNLTISNNLYSIIGIYSFASNIIMKKLIFHNNSGNINQAFFDISSGPTDPIIVTVHDTIVNTSDQQLSNFPVIKFSVLNGTISIMNLRLHLKGRQHGAIEMSFPETNLDVRKCNISISCPSGSNPNVERISTTTAFYRMKCNECIRNTYALTGGTIHLTNVTYTNILYHKTHNPCKVCPNGGECSNGHTKSRGYFFGFKETYNTIKYIPCPTGYCCSNKTNCLSHNTCGKFRGGVLCGQCQLGYQEDFFSESKCVKTENCDNIKLFWILFISTVAISVFIIVYFEIFLQVFKKIFYMIKKKAFGDKCVDDNCPSPNDIIRENEVLISTITQTSTESVEIANEKVYTVSGIISILVSYFQIKSLLTVARPYQDEDMSKFLNFLSRIFNIDLLFNFVSTVCPTSNIDAVKKRFMKQFLFNVSLPLSIILLFVLKTIVSNIIPRRRSIKYYLKNYLHERAELRRYSNLHFVDRLCLAYIRTLLFTYKNLTFFALKMIHCIVVSNKKVLFIQGNRECYENWQYAVIAFIAFWIIPFPIVLWQSYHMFMEKKKINFSELLFCITIPAILPWYLIRSYLHHSFPRSYGNLVREQMVKEIFTESYRCKLTSVSNQYIFWEHWRLYQRLLLAILAIFIINPLERSCYFMPVILFFVVIYLKVLPYKPHLKLLHWCEVVSLVSFCFVIVVSVFDGFFFTYSISEEEPVPTLRRFFVWMDIVVSPVTLLLLYFLVLPLLKKVFCRSFVH